jgi:hypothetical protein
MKRNFCLLLLSVIILSSCFEKKKDDPQPQVITPVTPKGPVLNGLYAYMTDTISVAHKLDNVEFANDSIYYKQCCGDTTHTNIQTYIYAHYSNGDFVEQLVPQHPGDPNFRYYQYIKTTSKGFIEYNPYGLLNKTTIPSDTTNTISVIVILGRIGN